MRVKKISLVDREKQRNKCESINASEKNGDRLNAYIIEHSTLQTRNNNNAYFNCVMRGEHNASVKDSEHITHAQKGKKWRYKGAKISINAFIHIIIA